MSTRMCPPTLTLNLLPPPPPPPSHPPLPRYPPPRTSRDRRTPYGPDRHRRLPPPPPPPALPTRPHSISPPPTPHQSINGKYDKNGVGINVRDLLGVVVLEEGVAVWEVKVRYRLLAQKLRPCKHDTEVVGMKAEEAVEFLNFSTMCRSTLVNLFRFT